MSKTTEDSSKPGDRSGGRKKRRRRSRGVTAPAALVQKPFRQPRRHFAPVDLASDEAVDKIHLASLQVLSDTGIKVLHEGARAIMKEAGADVDESLSLIHI